VLKNVSQGQGATSALTPALQRAVDRVTGGPHSSSLLRLNSSLQCYQPPPVCVPRCSQVSAKLESGAPFVNSSDDGYSIVDYYQLRLALDYALGSTSTSSNKQLLPQGHSSSTQWDSNPKDVRRAMNAREKNTGARCRPTER
jgi:hypothetical protein